MAACKSNNNTVAPSVDTNSFVGIYEGEVTLSYGRTGAMATERPQSVTLTVSRVIGPDQPKGLLFKEQYIGYSRQYSVYFDLDSTAFSVDKFQEQVSVNGTLAQGVASGIGKFSADGKKVSLYTSTDVIVVGPYNRSVKIEAIKR
ncbi:hypothetical protein GCM10028806_19730 [Spirosoma terrae]